MSIEALMIDTVTVYTVTDGATDKYGNITADESSGVDYPARVQQESSTENLEDRDTRRTLYTAFLPADAVVTALDVVEYEGLQMRVVGDPDIVQNAVGPHHQELVLEHFAG